MDRLRVAVVIPHLPERGASLYRALRSVANQTRPADEVIWETDLHREGAAVIRNRAWRLTVCDVVAMLDDDDELLPRHLEWCVEPLEAGRADMTYSWMVRPDWVRGEPLAVPQNGGLHHPLGIPFGPEQAAHLRQHSFISSCICVRRDWLERVGGYPEEPELTREYRGHDDWGIARRLVEAGARVEHVPHRTWRYNSPID